MNRRRRTAPVAAGLCLLWAAPALPQQRPDPIEAAGALLAECSARDPAAAPVCRDLSKPVANGKDPSALLPTVEDVRPGDLYIAGPWAAGIVLRRQAGGARAAFAVEGSRPAPRLAATLVETAAEAAALMRGAPAATPAAAPMPPPLPAATGLAPGWVTEVRPQLVPDGSRIAEDILARYRSGDPGRLYMGEYLAAMPLPTLFTDVQYVRAGLFAVTQPGDYRFAVTFAPHGNSGIASWTCWPRLTYLTKTDRVAGIAAGPIDFATGAPPARVKMLAGNPVTLKPGTLGLELSAQCRPDSNWKSDPIGAHLRQQRGRPGDTPTGPDAPWPTLVLLVQRPGEATFSPLRPGEIVHDRAQFPRLLGLAELAPAARGAAARDTAAELQLPAQRYRRGWYVDVFPIVGGAKTAWSEVPSAPLQATFTVPPAGFALGDHLRAGMAERDGKIYVANALYLAPRDGRYTFVAIAHQPAAPAMNDYGECLAELTVTDRDGKPTKAIAAPRSNALYSVGPNQIQVPAVGGVSLSRGAYRVALRTSCFASALADITTSPLAQTKYAVFVREPDEDVLHPVGPGSLVFRTK